MLLQRQISTGLPRQLLIAVDAFELVDQLVAEALQPFEVAERYPQARAISDEDVAAAHQV